MGQVSASVAALAAALQRGLSSDVQINVAELAHILVEVANGTLTAEEARERLARDATAVVLFQSLAGCRIEGGGVLVDFANSENGNVTIGDVAGGNIVRLVLHQDVYNISIYINEIIDPVPRRYQQHIQNLVDDYTGVFGGRQSELDLLDIWLAQDDQPYAFLHAPTGRGKTALLIHWIARLQQRGNQTIAFVPISLRYGTASAEATLSTLAYALADYHGERGEIQDYNTPPDHLRRMIADYLSRSAAEGRKLLVVIDGLDEAISGILGRLLFPRAPGNHLRVLVSAREKALTTLANWLDELGWSAAQTRALALHGLDETAVSAIMHARGGSVETLAGDAGLVAEIARISEGDPLTIRFLIESLGDGSLTPEKLTALPPGLETHLRDWLNDLEQHSDEIETIYRLLSFCAVALGPLTDDDLERLDPVMFHRRITVRQAAKKVSRFILGDGSAESGYIFSHPRLRELFLERLLTLTERTEVLQRFIQYGQMWFVKRDSLLSPYLRQFWISHIIYSGDWDLVRTVLTEMLPDSKALQQPWATACLASGGDYSSYLSDLERLWQYAEQVNNVVLSLRCALISASIRSLLSNLSPDLLIGLVLVGTPQGRWSPAAVLGQADSKQKGGERARILLTMLDRGVQVHPHIILGCIKSIAQEQGGKSLYDLVYHLSNELLSTALQAAHSIPNDSARSEVLRAIINRAAFTNQPYLFAPVLNIACSMADEEQKVSILNILARQQLADLVPALRDAAVKLADPYQRCSLLCVLVRRLPYTEQAGVIAAALDSALRIQDEDQRSAALFPLTGLLAPDQLPAVLSVTLITASPRWQCSLLCALVRHLPSAEQPHILAIALDAALSIKDEETQYYELKTIVTYWLDLSPAVALEQLKAAPHDWQRASLLNALTPKLPGELLPLALQTAHMIGDEYQRAFVLIEVAHRLEPAEQAAVHQVALETALGLSDAQKRFALLRQLIDRLPPAQRPQVCQAALDAIVAFGDDVYRTPSALQELATYLTPELLPDALSVAFQAGPSYKSAAIEALLKHLPAELLPAALASVCATIDEQQRAVALAALALRLPSELLKVAFEAACVLPGEALRIKVFKALAPVLSGGLRSVLVQGCAEFTDAGQRYSLLIILAEYTPPADRDPVYALAFHAAHQLVDPQQRASALVDLAPHLPAADRPRAYRSSLDAAGAIADPRSRSQTLVSIAPHLPAADRPRAYRSSLDAAGAIADPRSRSQTLVSIAPQLPAGEQPNAYAAAMDAAHFVGDTQARIDALIALAPHLPEHSLEMVVKAAGASGRKDCLVRALMMIARHQPDEQQAATYKSALEVALEGGPSRREHQLLPALASHVPVEAFAILLEAASTSKYAYTQAEVLLALAPRLPVDLIAAALSMFAQIRKDYRERDALSEWLKLLSEANLKATVETARGLQDLEWRITVLTKAAYCLPDSERPEICAAVLESIGALDSWQWTQSLKMLAPILARDLRPRALEVALAIRDERWRTDALVALAQHLPDLLPDALQAARELQSETARAEAIAVLIPSLVQIDPSQAYELTHREVMTGGGVLTRARTLRLFSPQLPPDVLTQLIDATRTIPAARTRSETLGALAPYLPATLITYAVEAAAGITEERWQSWALEMLGQHADPAEQEAIYIRALDAVLASKDEDFLRVDHLVSLVVKLPPALQANVYNIIFDMTRAIIDREDDGSSYDEWFDEVLEDVYLHLPVHMQREALQAACNIQTPSYRVGALSLLAPHLSDALLAVATREILSALDSGQHYALEPLAHVLAERLVNSSSDVLGTWHYLIRFLAARGRPELMSSLAMLIPCVVTLTDPANVVTAIDEVSRCWP